MAHDGLDVMQMIVSRELGDIKAIAVRCHMAGSSHGWLLEEVSMMREGALQWTPFPCHRCITADSG